MYNTNMETPQSYRDPNSERRIMSHRRTDSWDSEATISGDSDPLIQKSGASVVLDLTCNEDDTYFWSAKRRRPWIKLGSLFLCSLMVVLLTSDVALRLGWAASLQDDDVDEKSFLNWGKTGSGTERLSWYPTNFLQDVIPKRIHSHNDYWRKVPLFTALKQGCMSVEADVWLFDDPDRRDHLYVGHSKAALQRDRTFQSLYIQPLVEILTRQNPTTEFYNGTSRGVFDTAPEQTLTLLVDVKTAGPKTWTKVVEQLEPLRERGWLTHFANGTIHQRAITVVGTGNTPFDLLTSNDTYRDYFFDAPLNRLAESPYDMTNSYFASVSFGSTIGRTWMGKISKEQIRRIRLQVKQAHAKGLKARYWDIPEWPVTARNRIWDLLVQEGVDLLNADNVKAAAKRGWEY
ncbi:hypothetical protein N8I77_009088 [Diaporthe amygdali]|uniref:Altered inheritance of mitochondria protein 6 n=1 Tax=Phomopsis amygdali TaxID=1214568 RepID=A0AAD9W055_PHOAM|nr:hypothetical protein N8I77_009088 [Diaporthe amygdali]